MTSQTIAIIDYGSGNLRSAAKAFDYVMKNADLAADVVITNDAAQVAKADKIVLPGQGAFGDCMAGLRSVDGMVEAITEKVLQRGTPFFGICVGMQLLAEKGLEHGEHAGLGWIPGIVRRMTPDDSGLKIPHMGWNGLIVEGAAHPVLRGITKNADESLPDFYFVHSFVFECSDPDSVAAWCDYGGKFAAMVAKDNFIGTQFHPEKSQSAGLELIRGFIRWNP